MEGGGGVIFPSDRLDHLSPITCVVHLTQCPRVTINERQGAPPVHSCVCRQV